MSRKSSTRVDCTSRLDVSAEAELDVIVAVYRFVLFGSDASKKAAETDYADDAEVSDNDPTDTKVIPE